MCFIDSDKLDVIRFASMSSAKKFPWGSHKKVPPSLVLNPLAISNGYYYLNFILITFVLSKDLILVVSILTGLNRKENIIVKKISIS